MSHVKDILAGIAALIALFAVLAVLTVPAYFTSEHNRQKVQELTRTCVQRGYTGWLDDHSGRSGCFR